MSTHATTLPPPQALLQLSAGLASVWALLGRGIGLWAVRERGASLPMRTHARAGRLIGRVQAILALLAAGRLPKVRPPRPRPLPSPPAQLEEQPAPKPGLPPLPRRIGWLMGHHLEINIAANHLRLWLADPGTQTVLAEMPQARRPLAALCRALAIPPWPHPPLGPLPPPIRRPRKPRPPKPRRPTLAEDRAAVWHHRCYETDTGFVRPGRRPWWMPPRRKRH